MLRYSFFKKISKHNLRKPNQSIHLVYSMLFVPSFLLLKACVSSDCAMNWRNSDHRWTKSRDRYNFISSFTKNSKRLFSKYDDCACYLFHNIYVTLPDIDFLTLYYELVVLSLESSWKLEPFFYNFKKLSWDKILLNRFALSIA